MGLKIFDIFKKKCYNIYRKLRKKTFVPLLIPIPYMVVWYFQHHKENTVCDTGIMVIIPVFQTGDVSSILTYRSREPNSNYFSNYLENGCQNNSDALGY